MTVVVMVVVIMMMLTMTPAVIIFVHRQTHGPVFFFPFTSIVHFLIHELTIISPLFLSVTRIVEG